MSAFILGMVVGVVINLITALISRRHAIWLLPWLLLYMTVHGTFVVLQTNIAWSIEMRAAQKFRFSYIIVMLTAAILAGLYWRVVNVAVSKLDKATKPISVGPSPEALAPSQEPPSPIGEPPSPKITNPPHKAPTPIQSKPNAAEEKAPTLTTLFRNDFNVLKITKDNTVKFPDGTIKSIKQQVYLDFDAKVDYVGFLILSSGNPTDSESTFQICRLLSDHVQDTVDFAKKGTTAMDLSFGRRLLSTELEFSGRVFIYHEDSLSLEQRADLTKIYRAKNYSVEFRGPDYLAIRLVGWAQDHMLHK